MRIWLSNRAVQFTLLAATALLVLGLSTGVSRAVDQAPQGSWPGTYGAVGYDLAGWNGSGDSVSLPSAVSSLTLAQGHRWVWSQTSTDVRALQSPDKSFRRAATYYDANEVKVVLSFGTSWSGNLHLYAVDFDHAGRRESITVAGQTTVLSSDFSQGAWVTAPVSVPSGGGSVTITVDRTAGLNAVLSGIFLGDSGSPPSPAWAQAPQGSWPGTYGSDGSGGSGGYDLAGWNGSSDSVSLPSAVSSLTLAQGHRWVWSQTTPDVRVLQSPDKSFRRAATYYDANEVKVVLSFGTSWSGNLHLYALDFDHAGRRESITVGGQTTMLSSDFSQGAWVTAPVSVPSGGGSVTITVDRTAGPNAMLAGIFLGDSGPPPSPAWAQAPQGSWPGTYGAVGYDLAGWNGSGDSVSLPSAVSSLTLAQGHRWVWSQTTPDVQALQSPDKSFGRAATYYDANEVKVVLSFGTSWSGNLHLYALDFDHAGRRESITVGGQTTMLSSDFSQGAWVTAPVSVPTGGGSVTITVDRTAGPNAVLSGIFLGDTPHLMVIAEENHSYSQIVGNSSVPYINSLISQYGLATNWWGLSHPSEPNYLGMISGSIWDNPSDLTPQNKTYAGPTVVDQMASAGIDWKAYMEDMRNACDLTDTFSPGSYDVNHNPFMYFDTIRNNPAQCNRDVPFTQFATDLSGNTAPPFMFVSPNLQHDMHNGTPAEGDSWLQSTMSEVLASQWYAAGGTVIITWDEGGSPSDQIATIVVSQNSAGKRLSSFGNHYGMLRAIEEAYGLPLLGNAAGTAVGDLTPLF